MIGRLVQLNKYCAENSFAFRRRQVVDLSVMRNLFIQVKDTPNPNFMKFTPTGRIVMESGKFF